MARNNVDVVRSESNVEVITATATTHSLVGMSYLELCMYTVGS